jgi:diguanylate cyclase (GGDEF)-like protein
MPTILIVDDNNEMVETLHRLFSFYQFDVITAGDGKLAIERAEKQKPDLILLDAHLPIMDGFEVCKILKQKKKTKNIPIVFLTARYIMKTDRITGLQLGADDYIVKPFNSKELVSRIKTILRKNQLMKTLKQSNKALLFSHKDNANRVKKNKKSKVTVEEVSVTDPLTGLYNKKYFLMRLKEEYHRALRYENSMALILINIDSFMRINDTLGYQLGDYILMKMANVILMNTRITDLVARIEGDKYAVILPQTGSQGGFFEAERIRVAIGQPDHINDILMELDNLKIKRKNEHKIITVSIGVATFPTEWPINSEKVLLEYAEDALNQAKAGGKNKTVIYTMEKK